MSNDHKSKSKAKISRKRAFSCLSFCFAGSPVLDDDGPTRPTLPVGSKRKSSRWLPWVRSPKKMKSTVQTKTPVATFQAKSPGTRPAAPKSSSKENSGPVSTLELKQTSRALVATNKSPGKLSAGSSFNSAQFQTRSRNSVPETRPVARSGAGGGADSTVLVRGGTFAPVVGLWIMATTLAIMVLAGPAAAVVCFCCCLYLWRQSSPATTTAAVVADSGSFREDLNSEEHKKRVILEGLLERNGRRPSIAASTAMH